MRDRNIQHRYGQQSGSVFELTASNPNESYDACGNPITPTETQDVSLSDAASCTSGTATWSSEFGNGPSSWTGQVPASLKVVQNGVHTYSSDELVNAGFSPSCKGIIIAVTYQVLDKNGKPYNVKGLVPQEMMSDLIDNGIPAYPTPGSDKLVNFQFVDIYPGEPQKYTTSNGTFSDDPFGACARSESSSFESASDTQQLRLVNPKNSGYWNVRTNYWKYSSSGPGHGNVTNNQDVSASR